MYVFILLFLKFFTTRPYVCVCVYTTFFLLFSIRRSTAAKSAVMTPRVHASARRFPKWKSSNTCGAYNTTYLRRAKTFLFFVFFFVVPSIFRQIFHVRDTRIYYYSYKKNNVRRVVCFFYYYFIFVGKITNLYTDCSMFRFILPFSICFYNENKNKKKKRIC